MDKLKKTIQFILMLVMVVPLEFHKFFFYPFITSKVLAFRILVLLALALSTWYIIWAKKIQYIISKIHILFLSLIGVSFISAIVGVNFSRSFWSNMERADGIVFLIYLFIYFALLVFAFKGFKDWKWLFRTSVGTSMVVVGYGILQYSGVLSAISTTGDRISSTLGNPAYLGSYAMIHVFIVIYLIVKDKIIGWRIFYGLGLLFNSWILFLTQTRGSVIGLIVGLGVLGILTVARSEKVKLKKIGAAGLLTVILISTLAFVFRGIPIIQSNDTLRRVTNISFDSYTVQTRLAAWRASMEAFKEKPIFGWGPENYGYAFSKYFPEEIYIDSGSRIWFDKAHNVFFEYLVTTGLVGVSIYLGLIGLLFFYLFKSKQLDKLSANIFISMLVAYLVANMFVFDTVSTYILFAMILAWINNCVVDKEGKMIEIKTIQRGLLGLIILFVLYTGYILNVEGIRQNKGLLMAEAYAREKDAKTAYSYYVDTLEGNNSFTRNEVSRSLAVFVRNSARSLPDYEASSMFDKAIEEMQITIKKDPLEVRHYYNLVQLYLNSYKYDETRLDKVVELASKMIELAPTRAHTYYQIGEAYIMKREYDKALENFNIAVGLNPDIIDPYVNVYAAAILKGDETLISMTKEKMESISPGYFDKEDTLVRFLPLYEKAKMSDKVIESLERLIEINPEKIDYTIGLSVYYAEKGDSVKAEDILKTLLGKSDELDTQINSIIEKIRKGEFVK